jgi:predicted ATPase
LASPAGFFLRAEAMHSYFATMDSDPSQARAWEGEKLQERSHGESFLAVLRRGFAEIGVYFMDEPEVALSFRSTLGLVSLLDLMSREGSQVIVASVVEQEVLLEESLGASRSAPHPPRGVEVPLRAV